MKTGRSGKFRGSLLSRYLLIMVIALLFIPVVFPAALIGYQLVNLNIIDPLFPSEPERENPYTGLRLERTWHQEAKQLKDKTPAQIDARLKKLSQKYDKAAVFWVDGQGNLREPGGSKLDLPKRWSASDAMAYMKKYRESHGKFTVVAFIGDAESLGKGFMVIEVPKEVQSTRSDSVSDRTFYFVYVLILLMFLAFVAVSWMFFVNMRRRLLSLQYAMTVQGQNGLPEPIQVKREDEIGQLENAFNGMVAKLGRSLKREREEEELRKRLIANLSHDLRTPLTVIRGHVHTLQKEPLSDRGQELLKLTEAKLGDLGGLIDNLLSYNLLTSGRYTLQPVQADVLRIVRESAAAWYPLWEKEGFEVDVSLQEEPLWWLVDIQWFRRILDNLFQNVLRHAHSGLYIGIATETAGGRTAIVISDHGQGMQSSSGGKGAGIGLAIIGFLTREMGLSMLIESSSQGTRVLLYPAGSEKPGLMIK